MGLHLQYSAYLIGVTTDFTAPPRKYFYWTFKQNTIGFSVFFSFIELHKSTGQDYMHLV